MLLAASSEDVSDRLEPNFCMQNCYLAKQGQVSKTVPRWEERFHGSHLSLSLRRTWIFEDLRIHWTNCTSILSQTGSWLRVAHLILHHFMHFNDSWSLLPGGEDACNPRISIIWSQKCVSTYTFNDLGKTMPPKFNQTMKNNDVVKNVLNNFTYTKLHSYIPKPMPHITRKICVFLWRVNPFHTTTMQVICSSKSWVIDAKTLE